MAGLEATVKIAVVGVPGQGKSTFLNLVSGEEDDAFAVGCGKGSKTQQTQWGDLLVVEPRKSWSDVEVGATGHYGFRRS